MIKLVMNWIKRRGRDNDVALCISEQQISCSNNNDDNGAGGGGFQGGGGLYQVMKVFVQASSGG